MKRLAVIITHPIQYYAPLFKLITERRKVEIKVFYTWEQSKEKFYDTKFGKEIKWDIPLLDGYEYTFTENKSKHPGSGTYKGVVNPWLINEIEEWGATAVLIFGWNHHSHFKAMRYFKGKIPVWFRGDSTLIDEITGIKRLLRRIFLKFIYRYIDYAFYVGTNNKAYFQVHGLREDQLIFVPHAVDNERFYDVSGEYQKKADAWRIELGIKNNDKVFLFVGKFETKKDPLIMIEAAKKLPEYKFLFVGSGELEKEMEQQASENVIFLPFQNQTIMPVVYRLGDVFVLPSKGPGETWGLAVNEAMACGKAILVSDKVGCAVDLVKNNENGFIFKTKKKTELVQKIKLFNSRYESFGNKSKIMIREWSFNHISNIIEETANGS